MINNLDLYSLSTMLTKILIRQFGNREHEDDLNDYVFIHDRIMKIITK